MMKLSQTSFSITVKTAPAGTRVASRFDLSLDNVMSAYKAIRELLPAGAYEIAIRANGRVVYAKTFKKAIPRRYTPAEAVDAIDHLERTYAELSITYGEHLATCPCQGCRILEQYRVDMNSAMDSILLRDDGQDRREWDEMVER